MGADEPVTTVVAIFNRDPSLMDELQDAIAEHPVRIIEPSPEADGIEQIRQARPAAVLLDLAMPKDEAAALLATISERSPGTPIVLVSENGEFPASMNDLDLDAFEHLSRPLTPSTVEHALRHVSFHSKLQEASMDHLRYLERRNVQLDVRLHELEKASAELQRGVFPGAQTPAEEVGRANGFTPAEKELRVIQVAIDSAADAIMITDDAGLVIYANLAFEKIFGSTPSPGASYDLRGIFVNPGVADNMRNNIESLGTFGCEVPMRGAESNEFHALVRADAIKDRETGETGRLYIFSDITEQEQLRHQAYHDALTGLFSRRHFMELLQQSVSLARRHGHSLCLCFCDLDSFKSVNDTYGHRMGDDVLEVFGKIILEEIRMEDIAGRLGGDEFCMIFPYVSAEAAVVCLERLRKRFSATTFTTEDGSTFQASATFGVADMNPDESSHEALIDKADRCLYKAKELGRNCTVVNGEIHT